MNKKSRKSRALLGILLFGAALGVITYYGFIAAPKQPSMIVRTGRHVGTAEAFNGFLPDRPGEYTCGRTWGVVEQAAYKTAVGAATAMLPIEQDEQAPHDVVAGEEDHSDKPLRLSEADTHHDSNVIPAGQPRFAQVAAREVGGSGLPLTIAGGSGGPLGSSGKNPGTPNNNGGGTSGNGGGTSGGGGTDLVPDNKSVGTPNGNGGNPGNNGGNPGNGGNQGGGNQGGDGGGKSVSVPEPDVLVLLLAGAVGLWFARRRFVAVQLAKAQHSAERR